MLPYCINAYTCTQKEREGIPYRGSSSSKFILTLSTHAEQGLQYWCVCLCACVSVIYTFTATTSNSIRKEVLMASVWDGNFSINASFYADV